MKDDFKSCPKCGRKYKRQDNYDIHVAGCNRTSPSTHGGARKGSGGVKGKKTQKVLDRMKEKLNVNDIRPISVRIECRWSNTRRLIYQESFSVGLDYANPGNIVIRNMPVIPNTRELGIKVFFDDKLVCYQRQSVSDSEVIK